MKTLSIALLAVVALSGCAATSQNNDEHATLTSIDSCKLGYAKACSVTFTTDSGAKIKQRVTLIDVTIGTTYSRDCNAGKCSSWENDN